MFVDLPLAAVMDVIRSTVMVLFVLSSFLLTVVILLQEGKGGGLAGAFGGAGAETFGVKAGTVNKFTAWLAALFLGLALLHAGLSTSGTATAAEKPPIGDFVDPDEPAGAGDEKEPEEKPGDAGDEEKPGDGGDEKKPGDGG